MTDFGSASLGGCLFTAEQFVDAQSKEGAGAAVRHWARSHPDVALLWLHDNADLVVDAADCIHRRVGGFPSTFQVEVIAQDLSRPARTQSALWIGTQKSFQTCKAIRRMKWNVRQWWTQKAVVRGGHVIAVALYLH